MGLSFCNRYTHGVSICISWWDPTCINEDGSEWAKAGWWGLNPGECKEVLTGRLTSGNRRYYYFYAEARDGAFWSGPYPVWVPPRPFHWCDNISSSDSREVGMREQDIDNYDNFTIDLVP
jgi:uncharacterized membrane protein